MPRVKELSKKDSFRTIELCYNCGRQIYGVCHVLVLHSSFLLIGLQNACCRDMSFFEMYDNGYRSTNALVFIACSFVFPYSYFIKNGN